MARQLRMLVGKGTECRIVKCGIHLGTTIVFFLTPGHGQFGKLNGQSAFDDGFQASFDSWCKHAIGQVKPSRDLQRGMSQKYNLKALMKVIVTSDAYKRGRLSKQSLQGTSK